MKRFDEWATRHPHAGPQEFKEIINQAFSGKKSFAAAIMFAYGFGQFWRGVQLPTDDFEIQLESLEKLLRLII